MANYYGAARSNYFKVNDLKGFIKKMKPFNVDVFGRDDSININDLSNDDEITLLSDYDGGWNWYIDDGTNFCESNPVDLISPFLQPNQVCILMEGGAEKLRYINGYAIAFDNTGESIELSLYDIYAKAKKKFGVKANITRAEY